MNRWQISGISLIVLVSILFARYFFQGAEGRIRGQLARLEGLVSYSVGEGNLQSVAQAKRLSRLFTEETLLEFKAGGRSHDRMMGRAEVLQAALTVRKQISALEAKLYDIMVELADDKQSAKVRATGWIQIAEQESAMKEDFVFTFRKTDGGWLIHRIENAETSH